jgi:hypothetical protein
MTDQQAAELSEQGMNAFDDASALVALRPADNTVPPLPVVPPLPLNQLYPVQVTVSAASSWPELNVSPASYLPLI